MDGGTQHAADISEPKMAGRLILQGRKP